MATTKTITGEYLFDAHSMPFYHFDELGAGTTRLVRRDATGADLFSLLKFGPKVTKQDFFHSGVVLGEYFLWPKQTDACFIQFADDARPSKVRLEGLTADLELPISATAADGTRFTETVSAGEFSVSFDDPKTIKEIAFLIKAQTVFLFRLTIEA